MRRELCARPLLSSLVLPTAGLAAECTVNLVALWFDMRFIKLYKRQPSGEKVLWALFLYRGYKFRGTRVMCFRISGVSQAVSARSERKIRGEMSGKMCCVFTVSKVYTFRRLHSTSYFLMRHGTPASKSRTKAVASRLAVLLSIVPLRSRVAPHGLDVWQGPGLAD